MLRRRRVCCAKISCDCAAPRRRQTSIMSRSYSSLDRQSRGPSRRRVSVGNDNCTAPTAPTASTASRLAAHMSWTEHSHIQQAQPICCESAPEHSRAEMAWASRLQTQEKQVDAELGRETCQSCLPSKARSRDEKPSAPKA